VRFAALAFGAAFGLAGCATVPTPAAAPAAAGRITQQSAPTFAVVAGDFETDFPAAQNCPPHWMCRVHADPASFRISSDATTAAQGSRSLRIEKIGSEPWATVLQSLSAREAAGHRVRFSLAMRMEGVAGLGAGPWIITIGPGGLIEHRASLEQGTRDWRRVEVEVDIPSYTDRIEIGAIIESDGRIWIDDARLEVVGAGSRP
jgi:hypothetical protein